MNSYIFDHLVAWDTHCDLLITVSNDVVAFCYIDVKKTAPPRVGVNALPPPPLPVTLLVAPWWWAPGLGKLL